MQIVLDALRPAHVTSVAGNADSKYWTPTDEARRALAVIVGRESGIALGRAVGTLPRNLDTKPLREWARALRMGLVPGVRSEGRAGRMTLWTEEETL
jgi:hypothetical protein